MKLLKLEIGNFSREKQFRSLHSGYSIHFHHIANGINSSMEEFNPFCFVGLNGRGKSNVLEALASIFFHLECCVASYNPKTFEKYFRPQECTPDAFTLEYLIGQDNDSTYIPTNFEKIVIRKESGKSPIMYRHSHPFTDQEEIFPVSLEPKYNIENPQPADGKRYLPDIIIGYSSGENEILSLPFRKSRLINFDKYREDYIRGYKYKEPENSMIYIDSLMSQAVLLSCLLFEDEGTLAPFRKELGIVTLRSFRMNLNLQNLVIEDDKDGKTQTPILGHIQDIIENLKNCASCWFQSEEKINSFDDRLPASLTMDFFVDDITKKLFRQYFRTPFDLFRFLQVLYELNANIVSESIKEEVYMSKGFYTDGKLPSGSPNQNVFYFLDFLIVKKNEGEPEPIELLLRELSDGEHQFLHTMGICIMLKDRRSLLLLDEPETHFNPNWRSKFIKFLNDSINAGGKRDGIDYNIHLLKDIILTSHSPFMISDCKPESVICFEINEKSKKIESKNAAELGLKAYGSSIDYILKNYFKTKLISEKSFDELKDIIETGTIEELREAVEYFGESSEKQFLFRKIYEKTSQQNDNKTSKT